MRRVMKEVDEVVLQILPLYTSGIPLLFVVLYYVFLHRRVFKNRWHRIDLSRQQNMSRAVGVFLHIDPSL
ncbi:hypothetical protein Q1695_002902 [Nippostrongylus brasiliensis]|nr:hypothetical protein Q1695_002902 [Nippostrongylus brasiliensis]